MKAFTTILFSVLLILSSVFVAAQERVPVAILQAEIDGTEIEPFGLNQLNIERDQEFTLKLQLEATEDVKDVEIVAAVTGYEFNDVTEIRDRVGPYDFDANLTYIKKLTLSLPDDVDLDDYKLRVYLSDRNGWEQIYNYALSVGAKRHELKIEDVIVQPGYAVTAGQALLTTVRLENKGEKDESDVKVIVSVPALGVSAVEYVEEVESSHEEETEEIFVRLPKCAEAGEYDMIVDVLYNDLNNKVSKKSVLTVVENDDCAPAPVVVQQQNQTEEPVQASTGKVRSALEIILLVLVGLLVIVGLVIGFARINTD